MEKVMRQLKKEKDEEDEEGIRGGGGQVIREIKSIFFRKVHNSFGEGDCFKVVAAVSRVCSPQYI